MTLPAALLLVFWWQRGRVEWRDVRPLAPWFVAAAAAGALTAWFEHQVIGAQGEAFELTLVERILLAGRVILFYLGKLVWPANLIFVYPRWTIDPSIWWQCLYPTGALVLAAPLAMLPRRGPFAGYLFFCGTLVPVLGFVNVYPFVFSYVADHFQYLATLGIIVPVAAGLAIAPQYFDAGRKMFLNRERGPGRDACRRHLEPQRVLRERRNALSRYDCAQPARVDGVSESWNGAGGAESPARGDRSYSKGALRARPGYVGAKNNLVLARMRLGDSLADQPGRSHTAIANYEAVVRLEPDHFRAHYNLGTLLMEVPGRRADAIAHLERAVTLEPKSVDAQVNLGIALADIPSRSGEAIAHLEAAVAAKPDLPVRALLERLHAGASRSKGHDEQAPRCRPIPQIAGTISAPLNPGLRAVLLVRRRSASS